MVNQKVHPNRPQLRQQKVNIEWDEIAQNPGELPFIVLVEGMQGVGKTHFSMTFPEPIFLLDTENRADVVAAKFAGSKKVYRKKITTFNELRQVLLQRVFTEHQGGTIVIDSGSDLQAMAELEYLEEARVEKIFPTYIWARVWEKIDNMLKIIRDKGFYCVITGRLREEYTEDGKRTGYYVFEGYKKLPYRVDLHLRLLPNFTAEVYKNGFRNEPINQVRILERPSYPEIMDKLIRTNLQMPTLELEEVKPSAKVPAEREVLGVQQAKQDQTSKGREKRPARETEETEDDKQAVLEALGGEIFNREGNHLTESGIEAQNGFSEAVLNQEASREQVVEAYKYGLQLGLDNATLKMLLYNIRGGEATDHDRISVGMTVEEIDLWKAQMDEIAKEFLSASN